MFDWFAGLASWSLWAPAFTTSTIVAAAGFLFGTAYKARVEKSIQARFDQELERLRSELRKQEEEAKAKLKRQDDEIESLKRGALAHMVARQTLLDQRRVEAIEKIWLNATAQPQLKSAAHFAQSMKMEHALEKSGKADAESMKLREFGKAICEMAGLNKLDDAGKKLEARPDRLHVPPIVWALYSTYTRILSRPAAQFLALREGVGGKILADPAPLLQAAKTALPHMEKFIDEHGPEVIPYLVEPLEEALFSELVKALETSPAADLVGKAAEIQRLAESAAQHAKMPPIPAGFTADPL